MKPNDAAHVWRVYFNGACLEITDRDYDAVWNWNLLVSSFKFDRGHHRAYLHEKMERELFTLAIRNVIYPAITANVSREMPLNIIVIGFSSQASSQHDVVVCMVGCLKSK